MRKLIDIARANTVSGHDNERQYKFLINQGVSPASLNDMWVEYLRGKGYEGSLPSMESDWDGSVDGVTAPVAAGALADQTFTENTGVQTFDTSGDFTGTVDTYSLVTSTVGVTINSSTGVVSFDTNAMTVQAATSIVVRATNAAGSADSGFSLTIEAAAGAMAANFGALTREGEGGFDVGNATAITSGDPSGHWQIVAGKLCPSATGQGAIAGTYNLTLDNGGTVTVTTEANARTVAETPELLAILDGTVAPASGETIRLRAGPFATFGEDFTGQPSNVTYAPADPLEPWETNGWRFTDTAPVRNVTMRGFFLTRPYDYTLGAPWSPTSNTLRALINTTNSDLDGLILEDFVIDGQLLGAREIAADGSGMDAIVFPTENNTGIMLSGTNNVTVRRGTITRAMQGVLLNGARNTLVEDLTISNLWGDAFILQNAAGNCEDNTIRNCHSYGVVGNSSTFHMDWVQFQPSSELNYIRRLLIEGCTHAPGKTLPMTQVDPSFTKEFREYFTSFTVDMDLENGQEPRIVPSSPMTITMPSAAASAGRQVVFRYNANDSHLVTFALDGADTYEGGTPTLSAKGEFVGFISDGTSEWKSWKPGWRPWMFKRTASQTLTDVEAGKTIHVDARTAPVDLTLPSGSQIFHMQRLDDSPNAMRLLPPGGGSMTLRGSPVSEIVFNQGYGVTAEGDGSGGWTITEEPILNQLFFGNRHSVADEYYQDITLRGNILFGVSTSSLLLEQNVENLFYLNNTTLPALYSDGNGDGVIDKSEGVSGMAVSITCAGINARSARNFTPGLFVTSPANFARTPVPGTDLGSLFLQDAAAENFATTFSAYFNGSVRADYLPETREEVITAALALSGGPLDTGHIGAAGTTSSDGYYDFDAGQVNTTQPAPVIESSDPADGATIGLDGAFALTFDQFMSLGVGDIVLRNVTDNAVIETFTAGVGDSSGSVTVSNEVVTITPGANLPSEKNVSIRIDADALTGHYGVDFAGIADDTTLNFTTEVGVPTAFAAVSADGGDYWRKMGVTSVTNGKTKFLFGWKGSMTDGPNTFQNLFVINDDSDIQVTATDSNGQLRMTFFGSSWRLSNLFTIGGNDTILMSVDTTAADAASGVVIYKNGVRETGLSSVTWVPNTTSNNVTEDIHVLESSFADRGFVGDVEFLYADFPTTLPDLTSAAVRAKFTPGEIGSDGSGPTGSQPFFYMTGDAAAWNSGTQLGSGGDFTVTGAFTDVV